MTELKMRKCRSVGWRCSYIEWMLTGAGYERSVVAALAAGGGDGSPLRGGTSEVHLQDRLREGPSTVHGPLLGTGAEPSRLPRVLPTRPHRSHVDQRGQGSHDSE